MGIKEEKEIILIFARKLGWSDILFLCAHQGRNIYKAIDPSIPRGIVGNVMFAIDKSGEPYELEPWEKADISYEVALQMRKQGKK